MVSSARVLLLVCFLWSVVPSQGGAIPGAACAVDGNGTTCEAGSRCADNGICCTDDVGFSCQSCESGTGECLVNDCFDCSGGEVCKYTRGPETGCCKSNVNADTCLTYCNLNGNCNPLFAPDDLCEIDQQCQTGNCAGLTFSENYCCKDDVGITCTACAPDTGDCAAQNYLLFVLAALAVLLLLTGISCFVQARRQYDREGSVSIENYGRGNVRILTPFDEDNNVQTEANMTLGGGEPVVSVEAERLPSNAEELEEVLEAEVLERPTL